ncbi:septum formation family protein [Prauserella cavernicola]|uniref:Septum formation family protein n=1 Tax=Prauserella cavernicola TaxID=2800127 RepID=A0A934V211_9PSEU|nr:septum formation family protein [Prauserella cavernicola]MBK1784391.1 septum formation family protein [Prauserella cavernicola]
MSDEANRFPPIKPAVRTRVLMVGVFLGAIVAMSLSWVFSWGVETEADRVEAAQEAAVTARREAFSSPPGSCLTWTNTDASDVKKVGCAQDHLFEVAGVVDISKDFPKNARLPNADKWRTLTEEKCGQSVRDYLDKPLDPFGKLSLGVLRPDEQQWAQGERKLHCGLQRVAPGGELQTLTGPAKEENQSNVWEPGTCLALANKTVGDPIDCAEEHSYEIVGLVNLANHFEDGYPSPEDQQKWLDTECSRIVGEYTGGAKLRDKGLLLAWDLREKESWDAGSTLVNCKVGAKLEDNSGLAAVRGSVSKEAPPPPEDKPKQGDAEQPEGERRGQDQNQEQPPGSGEGDGG